METLVTVLLWFCALGCTLIGGLYFAFSAFIMRALAGLGPDEGRAAMNSINTVILRSPFLPLFFGTTLACATLAVIGVTRLGAPGATGLVAGGATYVIGMFVVTLAFNVPLNDALLRGDAATWSNYLAAWTRWNHVRTVASLAAGAAFVASIP